MKIRYLWSQSHWLALGGLKGHLTPKRGSSVDDKAHHWLLFNWCDWNCGFGFSSRILVTFGYNDNKKKESDDASDESTPTRSKSQPVVRRNKEYRYPTHRWSQFKMSFDNDTVRLESEMHPLQSTGGAGGSAGGERAAGSLSTGPSGALMTTSSSISAAGGTIAPSAASTVPPTIKIIGKEVSRTIKIDGPCNASNKLARNRT